MRKFIELIGGLWRIFQGMGLTMQNFFRPKVTVRYPRVTRPVSARYRGMFFIKWNEEKQRLNCTGCTLCAQACPTDVISMNKIGQGPNAGVDRFDMDLGRCMFCNLCVEACPFDAIHMGQGYEFAVYEKDGCVMHLSNLAQGGLQNVERSIATLKAAAEAAERAAAEKARLMAETKAPEGAS